MRKHVRYFYVISIVFTCIMLFLFHFHEKTQVFSERLDEGFYIQEDFAVTTFCDETSPTGITQEYKWILTNIPRHDGCVAFYLIHQEVEVYLNDELIYQVTHKDSHNFSKTTGCFWAEVYTYPEDEGKEICIRTKPIYASSVQNVPTFYFGDHGQIISSIIKRNLPIITISIFAIIVGLGIIFFILYNIKNLEIDRSVFMLGVFSLLTGLWKLSDMEAATLLIKDPLVLSSMAIICIPLALVSYLYFIRRQFQYTNLFLWDFICIFLSGVTIGLILLQLFGIADLRATLIVSHAMIIFALLFIILMLIKESRTGGFSSKLKITVFCCILCMLGSFIDLAVYYTTGASGNTVYCLVAFLIYVISMCYVTLKDTKELLNRGQEATHYQQLAMHDELTGLFNRAHFSDYISHNDVLNNRCFLIMFDVNNLKRCNDTRGHDCGDRLLKNSAYLMKQAFPKGICHRIGGDEFCIIMKDSSSGECQQALYELGKAAEEYNLSHPKDFPIEIAYGYANYIAGIDFDISDTMRRADRMLYQVKATMKANASEKKN